MTTERPVRDLYRDYLRGRVTFEQVIDRVEERIAERERAERREAGAQDEQPRK